MPSSIGSLPPFDPDAAKAAAEAAAKADTAAKAAADADGQTTETVKRTLDEFERVPEKLVDSLTRNLVDSRGYVSEEANGYAEDIKGMTETAFTNLKDCAFSDPEKQLQLNDIRNKLTKMMKDAETVMAVFSSHDKDAERAREGKPSDSRLAPIDFSALRQGVLDAYNAFKSSES